MMAGHGISYVNSCSKYLFPSLLFLPLVPFSPLSLIFYLFYRFHAHTSGILCSIAHTSLDIRNARALLCSFKNIVSEQKTHASMNAQL